MRKKHSPDFMAKVGLEALKGVKTMSELSSKYEVHASVISRWRKRALAGIIEGFKKPPAKIDKEHEKLTDELYKQIGRLQVENDWLKKKSAMFEFT